MTKNAPLNEAKAPKFNLEKAIILLTDGLNTENRLRREAPLRSTHGPEGLREHQTAKIELYTVRVIEGNVDLLKNCATSPDMYYDVQDAGELNVVFETIASKLAKLHIAK